MNDINATMEGMIIRGLVIEPAAIGAASTNRFLVHCFGRAEIKIALARPLLGLMGAIDDSNSAMS